ncbi:MAG: hypothetical protein LKF79_06060 [Solobacterium sp.]|jgi:hypothetical protein|nr:hypothetical protein [Solobacterium sp.]MCH4222929.1 hypothetical protein [Solobacterium sp.]MCH4266188.1 hypothetical protein [Solobacterium sp.]
MIRKSKASSSNLFLLELILSILIFALASAVCVSFFMRSHTLSTSAYDLNHSVECADNAAEIVRSADSEEDLQNLLSAEYGTSLKETDEGNGYTVYTISCDSSFDVCEMNDAAYLLSIQVHTEGSLLLAKIEVMAAGSTDSIFDVTAEHVLKEANG